VAESRAARRWKQRSFALVLAVAAALLWPVPAYASNPSNGWYWQQSVPAASGWEAKECTEATVTCTGSSSTVFNVRLSHPNVPARASDSMAAWTVVSTACSNGSGFTAYQYSYVFGPNPSSGSLSTGYAMSNCPDSMAAAATVRYGYMYYATSPTAAQIAAGSPVWMVAVQFSRSSLPAGSVCSYSGTGSYSGGQLAVRLQGVASVPAGGWRVDAPDTGGTGSGTAPLTLGASNAVDGSPKTYYGAASVSTFTPLTARVTAISGTGFALCYLSLTLSSNSISSAADTSAGVEDDGTSCSGYNPLVYLKCWSRWAVVPSEESLDGLAESWSALSDRIPFAFLSEAWNTLDALVPDRDCIVACWPTWEIGGTDVMPYDNDITAMMRGQRTLIECVIILLFLVPLGVAIFWRLMPVIGDGE
jgi:hypothetical protein